MYVVNASILEQAQIVSYSSVVCLGGMGIDDFHSDGSQPQRVALGDLPPRYGLDSKGRYGSMSGRPKSHWVVMRPRMDETWKEGRKVRGRERGQRLRYVEMKQTKVHIIQQSAQPFSSPILILCNSRHCSSDLLLSFALSFPLIPPHSLEKRSPSVQWILTFPCDQGY